MLRVLLFIALAALPLYAFIDCAMKDETQIKNLPKWGWLLVILFTQAFGAIAYFIAGVTAEMAADLRRVLSDVSCRLMMTQISYVSSNSSTNQSTCACLFPRR
jgi:hypothetical protein